MRHLQVHTPKLSAMARRTLSSLDAQFIRPPIHFSNFDELLSVDQRVDAFGAPASATIEAARGLERHNTRSFAGLSEAVSRLQGLGGVVAIAPQQFDAVAEGGSGTIAAATPVPGFTVHITVDDVVCAACEAGDVRSQIATLFLCSVKCALGAALDATQARSMADICAGTATGALCATVAPPHGAESGHDPHVAFRNLQDPDSGLVLERMLHAYTHAPLTAADRHDDTWLAAFGEPKLSRVGYQEVCVCKSSFCRFSKLTIHLSLSLPSLSSPLTPLLSSPLLSLPRHSPLASRSLQQGTTPSAARSSPPEPAL